MVRYFLLIFILLVGSSIAFIHNNVILPNHRLTRSSRNHEQQRNLRNIMGKLFDTETNTIYSIDGQKQQGSSSNTEAAAASMPVGLSTRYLEDLACLEACYKCVEDYPLNTVSFLLISYRNID
jgi:hypothetical protein